MAELDDALKFTDDKSLSNAMNDDADVNAEISSLNAPLVVLQEICSGISPENIPPNHSQVINYIKFIKFFFFFSVFFFFKFLSNFKKFPY